MVYLQAHIHTYSDKKGCGHIVRGVLSVRPACSWCRNPIEILILILWKSGWKLRKNSINVMPSNHSMVVLATW